jgi:hypothetical protein
VTWIFEADSVQDYWNILEINLPNIINEAITFEQALNNFDFSETGSGFFTNKLNKQKR